MAAESAVLGHIPTTISLSMRSIRPWEKVDFSFDRVDQKITVNYNAIDSLDDQLTVL